MCRQAYERDVLKGDLNQVQIVALMVAMRIGVSDAVGTFKANAKHIDSLFEAWMALEKPEAYKSLRGKREEERAAESSINIAELNRDDMAKVAAKMKHLAAMERDKSRR